MINIGQLLVSGIFALGGAGVFWAGFGRMHQSKLIQDIPRSKIRSMAMGLVEVHGQFLAEKYLLTPFSQTKCVYYKYEIQEYRQSGKSHKWITIFTSEQRIPFLAKDETGQVYVNPIGAEINLPAKKAFAQSSASMDANTIVNTLKKWNTNPQQKLDISSWNLAPIDPQKSISWSIGHSINNRRYFEYYIEPEENLFIIGTASIDSKDSNKHLLKKGDSESTFIISNKSETELLGSFKKQMVVCFVVGALFLIVGIILALYSLGVMGK